MKYKYDTNNIINYIEWWMERDDVNIEDVYNDIQQYGDHFSRCLCHNTHHKYNDKWCQYMDEIIIPYINKQYKQWLIDHKLREIDSDF